MEILYSSLLRYESFFSIDDKRGIIIYLFKYVYHFKFLFQYRTIIHTLLNNLVDSQKKKKNNPLEVSTVFAEDFIEKGECIETMVFLLFEGQRTWQDKVRMSLTGMTRRNAMLHLDAW